MTRIRVSGFDSHLGLLTSLLLMCTRGGSGDGSSSSFWSLKREAWIEIQLLVWPGPTLAISGTWGVDQQTGVLCHSKIKFKTVSVVARSLISLAFAPHIASIASPVAAGLLSHLPPGGGVHLLTWTAPGLAF